MKKLCAKRWDHKCPIIFHNTLSEPIQMIWIDYEGNEQPFTVLNSGGKCCQQAGATHPFIMRRMNDEKRKVVSIFVPTEETVDYFEVVPGMFMYDEERDGKMVDEDDEEIVVGDQVEEIEEEIIEDQSKHVTICKMTKAREEDWKLIRSRFDGHELVDISIRNDTSRKYNVFRVDEEGNQTSHGYSAPISTFWATFAYPGNVFLLKNECGSVEFVLKVSDKSTVYIIESNYLESTACIDDDKQSSCRNILLKNEDKRIGPRKMGFNSPEIVQDIVNELKRRNSKFIDEDFPPRSDCVRAQNLFKRPAIFKNISVMDPIQGKLEDCFLISSISGAALRTRLLRKVFTHCEAIDPKLGLYALTFYLEPNNEKMTLLLDDYLPAENGHLKFAHSQDRGELWISLIEKGIAKLVGDYDKINPQTNSHLFYPSNILSLLLGGRSKQLDWFSGQSTTATDMMKKGTFWPLIEKLMDSSLSVPVCGTKPGKEGSDSINSNGLVNAHGYSLLSYRKFPEHDLKLVNLRNTWGRIEYNGPWSDNSPEWDQYPDVKKALEYRNADDGCFYMTYEAFENCFGIVWWND
ncbi:predicted protein [Naegleria gruberi]|uniref:Predicted protein n=1 Tax=Naegleria gruberi TaxID=5762 RepID=D2VZZ5_NAEGR|nr:uncharacterized protein NAEGRDRAFT_74673 [Naegleria gruberi]EFC37616.1 predicted protein [Naegleria gruberi]|eukprot:XP_002670360.1 predicted protein [Naegleria gruberi strain NEG-M]